jgi:hypothetical protein
MGYHEMMDTIKNMAASQNKFSFDDAMAVFNSVIWRTYANTNKINSFDECIRTFERFLKTGEVTF